MKRGILILTLFILMSSVVSAGLFSGVWQDYLTGRQVSGVSKIQPQAGLIYSIGPSVPIYSMPFNIVVVTNKPAICQYTFRSKDYQNPPYADFTSNGGTDHIQMIPDIYDGDTKVIFRCKEAGLFKRWEYEQTNFVVSTKGGCCIVGNKCNTYKSPNECTALGGALYPDPNCKYTNCQVAIGDVKKPDLIIENVDVSGESKKLRVRGEELVILEYKIFIKNVGNAPVDNNFIICGKVVGVDNCIHLTQVQQRSKEVVYESTEDFISSLVRKVLNVVSVKEVLDPIESGEVKEVNIGSSTRFDSFIVDVFIGKEGEKGLPKECLELESVPEGSIKYPQCLKWSEEVNLDNLIDELNENNNAYTLP